MEIGEEADGVPVGEEGGEGVALVVAELEGEEAAGFEGGVGLGDEAAVDLQAVGAGEEGGGGFVVADLRVECGTVGRRDVGWVGGNGVPLHRVVRASPANGSR